MHPLAEHYADLEQKITALIKVFSGRLSAPRLAECADYVDHNEFGLAVELFIEGLFEENVCISNDEYNRFRSLFQSMGMDVDDLRLKELWALVIDAASS